MKTPRLPLVIMALLLVLPPAQAAAKLAKIRLSTDGKALVTAEGQPFVALGVNYFRPGTGWAPQVWKRFEADAVRADFARLKGMGANCVRVFLSYGSFCQEPGVLLPEGLAKFDQFLALAEEAGLYVHPTGLDHWEGSPEWARGDRIADERNLAALEEFWKLFARRYRDRAVLFAYDLRNEPEVAWDTPQLRAKWNQWLTRKYATVEKTTTAWSATNRVLKAGQIPPPEESATRAELLDYQLFREDMADEWTRRQVTAIKAADPAALVTVGLIQWSVPAGLPRLRHYAGFRPSRQAKFCDFMEIHFYPLANGAYEYKNDEEELRNLAYLESVVREVALTGKPVIVAEFGWYGGGKPSFDQGRHPAATEEQQARWCRKLVEATAGLAVGWLNWGVYDHPESKDVTELTGLLTADGKTKAWGREFTNLARRYAGQTIPAPKLRARPVLNWEECLVSMEAIRKYQADYFRAFVAEQGL